MESERLLKEAFGLNTYEAKVYLALLKQGMRAIEAAQASGVPQSRTYDTLRALEQKGFVSEAGPIFHAVKPSTALRARVAKFSADFGAEQSARHDAMKRIIAETEPLYGSGVGGGEPAMLRGMDAIAGAFLEVLRSSDDVFIVARKGLKASAEFLEYLKTSESLNTKVRILVPKSARLSKHEVQEASRLGLDVRRSQAALLDMMVGDSGDVIIGVPAAGEEPFRAVGIWLKDKSFSAALLSTFGELWSEAGP